MLWLRSTEYFPPVCYRDSSTRLLRDAPQGVTARVFGSRFGGSLRFFSRGRVADRDSDSRDFAESPRAGMEVLFVRPLKGGEGHRPRRWPANEAWHFPLRETRGWQSPTLRERPSPS